MKVLEKGNWDNPWSQEVSCSEEGCGAKLLVEESDMKPVDYGSGYYASCAICEQKISVLAASLPLRLRKVIDKKRKYSYCGSWD